MLISDIRQLSALLFSGLFKFDANGVQTLVGLLGSAKLPFEHSIVALEALNDFLVSSEFGDDRPQVFEFDAVNSQSFSLVVAGWLEFLELGAPAG